MKRELIRCLGLAAAVLLLTGGATAGSEGSKKTENEPFSRLTVDEVDKLLADPNVRVYDGNRDELYREGHIPGAVHLFSQNIKEGVLPYDKSTHLIFYCHSER